MTTKAQTLTFLALAAGVIAGQAQTNTATVTTAVTPPLSGVEQTIADIKHPVSWFTWGGDFRARDEHFDNLLTLNPGNSLHEQDYWRFRARVWGSVTPVEDLSFNVRLVDEVREWLKPAGYTPFKGQSGLDWRYGIFDNLNVQWRNILDQPASLTVGRQDYFPGSPLTGEGWLLADGTPFDGSWTYFLDSAHLTYDFKEQHTIVDMVGIIQDAHVNGWLPVINPHNNDFLTEQNEKGAILNVANSSIKEANMTGYFIYKHDDAVAPANFRPDSGDIYTVGGRLNGTLSEHWKYYAEGAYQFGEKQDPSIHDEAELSNPAVARDFRRLSAYGANSRLTYLLKDSLNNQFSFSYEFLSGDNPNSKTDESFDLLWGRWPRWSEIGLYSYAAETRIGSEANLHRFGPSWSFTPVKDLDFTASYFALFSDTQAATRGPTSLFSDNGNWRGSFLSGLLRYKFSKHVSGHLLGEIQFPGDYYVNKTTMYFVRPEIMMTF
jgi:hypothetical protein